MTKMGRERLRTKSRIRRKEASERDKMRQIQREKEKRELLSDFYLAIRKRNENGSTSDRHLYLSY